MLKFQVGKTLLKDDKVKAGTRYATYTDIPDSKGWIDASIYLPQEFDLVLLRGDDHKIQKGWKSQFSWDGLHMKNPNIIKYWKIFKHESNTV